MNCVNKLMFFLTALIFLVYPLDSRAERPHVTEDLGTTEPGKFELEIGTEFENIGGSEEKTFTNEYALITGIYNRVELNVIVPFQLHDSDNDHEGLGDMHFLLKSRFLDEGDFTPAIGALFEVFVPSGDEEKGLGSGHTDYVAKVLFEKNIGKLMLDLNGGYFFIKEGVDKFFYAASAHYALFDRFHIVSELAGEADHKGKNEDPLFIMGGFQAHFTCDTFLDIGMRFGLTKDSPDYTLAAGITIPLN